MKLNWFITVLALGATLVRLLDWRTLGWAHALTDASWPLWTATAVWLQYHTAKMPDRIWKLMEEKQRIIKDLQEHSDTLLNQNKRLVRALEEANGFTRRREPRPRPH